jgi:16S rRNA (adenine1518-N6/adenine1519-N6)-dimethyltransferase
MNLSDLKALLEPFGITPVHDRGQNFLLDDSVVQKMLAAAHVKPGDNVLEIGPGPGILTAMLLDAGANVVAVELDMKLRALLRERFGARKNFQLAEGDVLKFSNEELAAMFVRDGGADKSRGELNTSTPQHLNTSYKLIANLPYAITSKAITKFITEAPAAKSVTIMIQREVADRILAKPRDMSSLAVLVQTYADVRRVTNVPSGAFFPPPKVDSAVIHMERKSDSQLRDFFAGLSPERYFTIVRTAFAAPRKQLKNTLAGLAKDEKSLHQAFIETKIKPSARPEELNVENWRRLGIVLTL